MSKMIEDEDMPHLNPELTFEEIRKSHERSFMYKLQMISEEQRRIVYQLVDILYHGGKNAI